MGRPPCCLVGKAQLEAQSQQVCGISQSTAPCDFMGQRVCRWRASVPSHPLQTRASFLLCSHTHVSVSFQRTFREIMLLRVSGQGRLPASPGAVSPNKGEVWPLDPQDTAPALSPGVWEPSQHHPPPGCDQGGE